MTNDDDNKANDKSLNIKKTSRVTIPEHLRSSLLDSLQHFSTQKTKTSTLLKEKQSDKELSSEIERLKQELAAIQKQKDSTKSSYKSKDMFKKLNRKSLSAPPPPSSISIRNRTNHRKRK